MTQYVLGLDGGGTKTHCAIFDTDGKYVDIINWGPTNHESMRNGFEDLNFELRALLDHLYKKDAIDPKQFAMCVFGMAGVDRRDQHKDISSIISGLGIEKFLLCNDAYLGLKAGSPSGYGISIVNGTGCTLAGIDQCDNMFQIGGVGAISDDPGGGSVLGYKLISSVYRYLFRCGPYTKMADYIFEILGIDSKLGYVETVATRIENGTLRVHDLNRLIFKAANVGDKVAHDILENLGNELGISVNGIIRELNFDKNSDLNIILAGSINVKGENPSMINALKQKVLSDNPERNFEFIVPNKPPAAGAIVWALSYIHDKQFELDYILNQFE